MGLQMHFSRLSNNEDFPERQGFPKEAKPDPKLRSGTGGWGWALGYLGTEVATVTGPMQ